ncbi:MAG: RluA family pseudouridine synthase [Candidatus Eiseniibacteriota bacterium]|nr:MAG: RluA family pseudouridine synthase [Candidatus Eisenbacteria bacterium]
MTSVIRKKVPRDRAGERLDATVPFLFPHVTRSQARRMIREELIRVQERPAKCSHRVRAGEEVTLVVRAPERSVLAPEPIPLDIRYEDRYIVVVNKPPGLVVHPGAGVKSGTLVNALLAHCRDLSGIGGVMRPGIVHRLDKGTSGLLAVAKTDQAHVGLAKQIADREVERKYLVIVWGLPGEDSGTIEAPISRDRRHRKKMAVDRQRGRNAVTHFSVLERFHFASYLSASLETGRTHQVRVHLSHVGHPVFGDPQYGGRTKALGKMSGSKRKAAACLLRLIQRPALHAVKLSFRHPVGGETVSVDAPLPPDMTELLGALRSYDER